jgi:hypothetical protein
MPDPNRQGSDDGTWPNYPPAMSDPSPVIDALGSAALDAVASDDSHD